VSQQANIKLRKATRMERQVRNQARGLFWVRAVRSVPRLAGAAREASAHRARR
jgi:hypothetical protein